MGKDLRQIEGELKVKIYITSEGSNLLNKVRSKIVRERKVILDEKEILIPGCRIYLVKNETIDGFVTKIDDEYCICVHSGVIEEQKAYLEKMDWKFISNETQRVEYINDIIEYGFYFFVFHEYAHVYCGHVDACLGDSKDKRAQECEADMFAMDYLVEYITSIQPIEILMAELEKLFLAVYFLFENMQKTRWEEWYNDKLLENYYCHEKEEKREHPLSAQRMLYLYEMINVGVITDKIQLLPVKKNVIEKLKVLKGLEESEIPRRDNDYKIAKDSVQKLKEDVKCIREKISRMTHASEI